MTAPETRVLNPIWLPGGDDLLVVSERGIELLNAQSGTLTFLVEGDSPRYARSGHIVFARGGRQAVWSRDGKTLYFRRGSEM